MEQAVAVVLPALICLGLCLQVLPRRWRRPEPWALLLNVLLFVVFLNSKSYVEYYASGRVSAGVVLAALYCLPLFRRLTGRVSCAMWACALLWFSVLPALSSMPRRSIQLTDVPIDVGLVAAIWAISALTMPATNEIRKQRSMEQVAHAP